MQNKPIETRNSPGTRRQEYINPPPPVSPAQVPRTTSGQAPSHGGVAKFLGGLALVGVLGVGLAVFGSSAVSPLRRAVRYPALLSETWSAAYQTHRLAKADSPLILSKADLDIDATKAAIDAARKNLPIPRITGVTPRLLSALVAGNVEIYTIRAYDTCREDGDWITIVAPDYSKQGPFPIKHQATSISVPVIKGLKGEIVVVAERDGVGGVTVGLESSDGLWYSQVLDEGTTQRIPVVIR